MNRLNGTDALARYQVASGSTITPGDLVALNGDGKAVPAADTAGLKVIGVAKSVTDGEVEIFNGVVTMENGASTAALSRADRGEPVYAVNAHTVGKTATNKIVAGLMVDLYDGDVYLLCDPCAIAAGTARVEAAVAAAAAAAKS